MITLTAQPAFEQLGVETIGLGAPGVRAIRLRSMRG